jgi:hypothetical protein
VKRRSPVVPLVDRRPGIPSVSRIGEWFLGRQGPPVTPDRIAGHPEQPRSGIGIQAVKGAPRPERGQPHLTEQIFGHFAARSADQVRADRSLVTTDHPDKGFPVAFASGSLRERQEQRTAWTRTTVFSAKL